MLGFLDAAVSVAYHLVIVLAHVLVPLTGGLATAAAIVAFTAGIRLLLVPLSYYALRGQAKQARLAPQVAELRRRHARHPDRLQRELAELYQREGGLLAGCLPLLLQLPFFTVMYRLFRSGSVAGHPNALLSHDLLGAPLGAHWLGGPGPASGQGLVFLALFALIAAVGWASARAARRGQPATSQVPADAASRVTAALATVLPYLTVAIAAFVPLAAGLYLLTTTAWTLAERSVLRRRAVRPAAPGSAPAGIARLDA
jgi:YidC/Oxa1 family membrane protein insertase